jgi:hypothetical protein
MSDTVEELKSTLHACGVNWSPLYDKGLKNKPYYFGIYKTVYKPGFETAEKLYSKRLQCLVNYIDTIDISNPKTLQSIDRESGVIIMHSIAQSISTQRLLEMVVESSLNHSNV